MDNAAPSSSENLTPNAEEASGERVKFAFEQGEKASEDGAASADEKASDGSVWGFLEKIGVV